MFQNWECFRVLSPGSGQVMGLEGFRGWGLSVSDSLFSVSGLGPREAFRIRNGSGIQNQQRFRVSN